MSKYHQTLGQIAQTELPSLLKDMENASTALALRDVTLRLLNVVTYLVHDAYLDGQDGSGTRPAAPPAPRPVPPARVPVRPTLPAGLSLPPPPPIGNPTQPMLPPSGLPADAPVQAGVTNVTITSTGTHVTTPGGQQLLVPPHQPVTEDLTTDQPAAPPEAPEGVANVVLPRGGGMSPELAAALSGRSNDEPPAK